VSESFDAVVIGMGPGGETVAGRLIEGGKRVAVVERELIGGECGYWACMPSKTLLRPPEARGGADRAAGVDAPRLDWEDAVAYRDRIVRNLDDGKQAVAYEEMGATVIRGSGRIAGPHRVDVDGRELEAEHIVVATGSAAVIPPIDGLDSVEVWTNREATTLKQVPDRVLMVGGGPVGVELGQLMARFGADVTLVQGADRLLPREDPRVCHLLEAVLQDDGIDVHIGHHLDGVSREDGGAVARLADGTEVGTDVVVIAAGRVPNVQDIGLEAVGVEPAKGGLEVDDRCSFGDGLWAVGDVTGEMLFTHVATYQGRIVAANILGGDRHADYRGVPRVVFSDPEVGAVGLTEEQAGEEGINVATATVDLAQAIARPVTYEKEPRGELQLVADRDRGVLVGAWAVAPIASEWIHVAAQAIRAEIPIATLLDGVAQFPTYNEAYLKGLEKLEV